MSTTTENASRKKRRTAVRKKGNRPVFRTVRKPAASKKKQGKLVTILTGIVSVLIVVTAVVLAARDSEETEPFLEYGRDSSLEISAADFTDPWTKNNLDLVTYATHAWENQWGYVWGTFGYELTRSQLSAKLSQYPVEVGDHLSFIRSHWLGRRTTDCIGLIKGYGWLDPVTGSIEYGSGAMPDIDADQMFAAATEKGRIRSLFHKMPEIPGLLVYVPGHIGVYIGDGYVIEARGTEYGVVMTKLRERSFTHWLKCPYITYYDT